MFGYRTILLVGAGHYVRNFTFDYNYLGRPLLPVDVMLPTDRPGVKFSLWDWVKLFATIIPRLPNVLVYNRSSVTDHRVHSVGSNK